MSAETSDFATLATRFRGLGAADRRAVLAKFSSSERQAFERRLSADAEEQRRKQAEDRNADRQFARYSRPIAAKVERAVRALPGEGGELTQACAASVARAHKAAEAEAERSPIEAILHKLGLGSQPLGRGARK